MSIFDYTERPVVLREPATRNGAAICPECGNIVEDSKGSGHPVRVETSTVVDDLPARVLEQTSLPTHGWVCERHDYDVVTPIPTTASADTLPSGWTSIRVKFSTGDVRRVPVPENEVA